ncbi:fatty acid desaturase [Mycobacterium cookii]|uniref:Delta 12 acyl-lipid desaturase n=1 Tax=Mycobacterium cookii TaxID=1775 RepID=A0A7I7KYS6_9MYCO|nr:fatty acid desaturase [Mycobacterium cookii]MCV7332325.1 fatty acid desaturase [Mycobacterium cookii]BBX46472.1 delta 12 acyl-lipid desaturase [Mycobacterium cookii]
MTQTQSRPDLPTNPDPGFVEFIRKSRALEGQKLTAVIPREYMQPSIIRGLASLAMSLTLYAGSLVGIACVDRWYLIVPLIGVAGLGGWGLHCIGHDCGHGSFSRNRRLNFAIGQFALLPLMYPFHAWRHEHNNHHSHTNNLELDEDWRPISREVYRRMPLGHRFVYFSTRTWALGTGSIHYWLKSSFKPSRFPKRRMRREARRSIGIVAVVGGGYLCALTYFTGVQGLLLYFVAPWFATHLWFSMTTMMHHSAEDIPYLPNQYWTRNASRLLVTTDYLYPRWLLFCTHYISLHTAHHVAPSVPHYHLPKAQAALIQRYPDMVRVEKASIGRLWNIIRKCLFYDPVSGLYGTHPMPRASAPTTTAGAA